jgi:hypothetical protein
MIELGVALVRGSGRNRMLLIATCTAVATALLLVAISILRLPERPAERLFNLVAEEGLRGGTAFATVLLVLPLLLLLYQVVRLGTATRERRLAALRVAGATPGEVRTLGALEVGIPVGAGAVAGLAVYALMRATIGGTPTGEPAMVTGGRPRIELVPTTVGPAWWQTLAIIAVVTGVGVLTGWRASRHVIVTPLGVIRRQALPPPRPWGLVLVGAAVLLGLVLFSPGMAEALNSLISYDAQTVVLLVAMLLAVLGMVSLAPWLAYQLGRWLGNRAASPVTLLAARQLVTDPRPSGRAAAAVGAIGLVAGGAGAIAAEVFVGPTGRGADPFFVGAFLLLGLALLVALVVTTGTLAVHAVESLLDRRRALASLVAAGAPPSVLHAAHRRAAVLVSLPLAAVGALLGAGALAWMGPGALPAILPGLLTTAVIVLLTWVATHVAAAVVRPWLTRATAPANLRTE